MVARLRPVLRLHRDRLFRIAPFALAAGLAGVVGACGSDDAGDESAGDTGSQALSDGAQRGRDLAQDNGCAGCHRAGGGGIGPDWEGLYGSTVTLDDGSTLVADDEYLTLAITDPDDQVVEGYSVKMPPRDMSDDDIAAVVAYIRELESAPEPTT